MSERERAARAAADGGFAMPRTIETERLRLGPLGPEHLPAFLDFWCDEASARYMGGALDGHGAWRRLAMFAGSWALYGFGPYALTQKDGTFVGFAGLWAPHDKPEIELIYGLMPEGRGRGYTPEAVRAIRAVAEARGVPSLVSYIADENTASQSVAAASGAVRDGSIELAGWPCGIWRHELASGAAGGDDGGILREATVMPLEVRTARLVLTQWRPDHFDRFAEHHADPESKRFTGGVFTRAEASRSMAAAAGHWLLFGYGIYAVEADGVFVGAVGLLNPPIWPSMELAYSLMADATGRGYATEAAVAVRDVAGEQGLDALASYIHPANTASQAVARRMGAEPGETIQLLGDPAVVWHHAMAPASDRRVLQTEPAH